MKHDRALKLISEVNESANLSNWEEDFVNSILINIENKDWRPSLKQAIKIKEIYIRKILNGDDRFYNSKLDD
jgi:hypothetical protein